MVSLLWQATAAGNAIRMEMKKTVRVGERKKVLQYIKAKHGIWKLHCASQFAGSREPDMAIDTTGYDSTLVPLDFQRAGQIVDDDILRVLVKPMRKGVNVTVLVRLGWRFGMHRLLVVTRRVKGNDSALF
jgi:hypothetical protein